MWWRKWGWPWDQAGVALDETGSDLETVKGQWSMGVHCQAACSCDGQMLADKMHRQTHLEVNFYFIRCFI